MGQFKVEIVGIGPHGCNRTAVEGDKLYARCSKLTCVDCLAFDFMLHLQMKGLILSEATFTHHFGAVRPEVIVVDDMLHNLRKRGSF